MSVARCLMVNDSMLCAVVQSKKVRVHLLVRQGRTTTHSSIEGEHMKIEHVAMYVNDLENARDFFVKYLGGRSNEGYHNKNTDFRSFFIEFDHGARLEIMHRPEVQDLAKPLHRTGYAHIAFSVGSRKRVDALTGRLKADGYEVVSGPRTTGDGYYESCIVVVEGNQIEITI